MPLLSLERQHLLFILGSVLIIVHIVDVAFFAAQSAQSGLVEYLLTAVVVLVGVLFRRLPPALVVGVGLTLGIMFSGGGIDHIRLWVTDGASPGDYTGIVELLGGMALIYVSARLLLGWRRQRTATTGAA